MIQHNREIREAIKSAIQIEYNGQIYTTRSPDVRDENINEYVNVFFDAGESDPSEGLIPRRSVDFVIGVHLALVDGKAPTDDDLDDIGVKIIDSIEEHNVLPELLSGMLFTGFEYSNDEEGSFSSLFLRYSLQF